MGISLSQELDQASVRASRLEGEVTRLRSALNCILHQGGALLNAEGAETAFDYVKEVAEGALGLDSSRKDN